MQGGDTMAMINAIWPFILMGGIFYFMLYRPQKQEQQKRQRMLDSLKKGDKVVLEPMNGYERKIIHVALQDKEHVRTESAGQDPYRHVVIYYAE